MRYGEKVHSPIVTEGECDYIISFEKLEAARYAGCLRKGGVADIERACALVLDDFRGGRLGRVSLDRPEGSLGTAAGGD